MLLKSVKILKQEQFVLLYYRLLSAEGVANYTQVMLKWMNSPAKHSSSNCMKPWDFYKYFMKQIVRLEILPKFSLISFSFSLGSSLARRYIRAASYKSYIKGITLKMKNLFDHLVNNWNHRQWKINRNSLKLLDKQELTCGNKKVESTFSW